MQPVPLVNIVRSGFTESIHLGSVAVTDGDGNLVASVGDTDRIAFARSSMKPLQAVVSLGFISDELPEEEVAVMCASHNGEPVHVAAVASLLSRAGLNVSALRCPAAWPLDEESARASTEKRAELHNCSGKHAGMLLASVRAGFDTDAYFEPDHPLQQAVMGAVTQAAGQEPLAIGIDGCGVPVHALPLHAMATIFARLVGGELPKASVAVSAMRGSPYLVGGRDRVCTALMEAADVIVKVGAEGLVCAGVPGKGLGVAIKIEDGNPRALDPAIIHALTLLGVVGDDPALERFARPPVLGGGRPVGNLLPVFDLERR